MRAAEESSILPKINLAFSSKLDFMPRDIDCCYLNNQQNLVLELNIMALCGSYSPLPQYFSVLAQQNSAFGNCLREFLSIFNSRIYFLLYQTWQKYHPFLFAKNQNDYRKIIDYLGRSSLSGAYVRNSSGLKILLTNLLTEAEVNIQDFSADWLRLSLAVLGKQQLKLGDNTFIGAKIISYCRKISICLGPVSSNQSLKILLNKETYNKAITSLIRSYAGPLLATDIILKIKPEKKPCQKLGIDRARIGWSCWLGVPSSSTYQVNLKS